MDVRKGLVAAAVAFGCCATALAAMETEFVIRFGARAHALATGFAVAAFAVAAVARLAVAAKDAARERRKRKRLEEAVWRSKVAEAEEARRAAVLSAKKKIDPDEVVALLEDAADGEWRDLRREIDVLVDQVVEIEDRARRLGRTLELNDASALSDASQAVEAVGDAVRSRARAAANYLCVLDPSDDDDFEAAKTKLESCADKNDAAIEKTREFARAVADFLNAMTDDDAAIETLDAYARATREATRRESDFVLSKRDGERSSGAMEPAGGLATGGSAFDGARSLGAAPSATFDGAAVQASPAARWAAASVAPSVEGAQDRS